MGTAHYLPCSNFLSCLLEEYSVQMICTSRRLASAGERALYARKAITITLAWRAALRDHESQGRKLTRAFTSSNPILFRELVFPSFPPYTGPDFPKILLVLLFCMDCANISEVKILLPLLINSRRKSVEFNNTLAKCADTI